VKKINYTKNDIVKNLSQKTGFSILFSRKLINDLLNILIKNIKINGLNLKNIGTFKLIDKKERVGRNPHTMEVFVVSSRKSISFNASKKIINILN
jgi:integration host factor subunit alpha